jgi:hypothetical protein
LITVEFMLALVTQTGVSKEAGWVLPATFFGGDVVELTRADGGV